MTGVYAVGACRLFSYAPISGLAVSGLAAPVTSVSTIFNIRAPPIIDDQLNRDRSPFSASVNPGRPFMFPLPSNPPIILEKTTDASSSMSWLPQ